MKEIRYCPICGKENKRDGSSKYCCGDCSKMAYIIRKRKNKEIKKIICQKIQTN